MKDPFFAGNWKKAIERIGASDFCRGLVSGKTWEATIDFLLQPDTVAKAIEGQYDNKAGMKPMKKKPMFGWEQPSDE